MREKRVNVFRAWSEKMNSPVYLVGHYDRYTENYTKIVKNKKLVGTFGFCGESHLKENSARQHALRKFGYSCIADAVLKSSDLMMYALKPWSERPIRKLTQ